MLLQGRLWDLQAVKIEQQCALFGGGLECNALHQLDLLEGRPSGPKLHGQFVMVNTKVCDIRGRDNLSFDCLLDLQDRATDAVESDVRFGYLWVWRLFVEEVPIFLGRRKVVVDGMLLVIPEYTASAGSIDAWCLLLNTDRRARPRTDDASGNSSLVSDFSKEELTVMG